MKEAEEVLAGTPALEKVLHLDQFFCGLHSIVHMTENVVAAQREWEKLHFESGSAPVLNPACARAGESGGSRFIQDVCKAFCRGGDERNGCFTAFSTYTRPILREEFKMTKNPFSKFIGARYVLGRNATYAYDLRHVIKEFLKARDSKNQLLRSLLHDVDEKAIMAEVRVCGDVSEFLLLPLCRALEDKSLTIAHMIGIYRKLIDFLEAAAKDPTSILEGQSPFDEIYLH